MARPDIGPLERSAVLEVLETSVLSIGPRVVAFEEAVAAEAGTAHGVAVNSGTAGLHVALLAAGIGPGDEVVTTPFSFIASANSILYTGARPVFVDIDEQTYNIDPSAVASAVTSDTRALLPVHAFGQPADMDPLMELATDREFVVVEDACEAIGARYKGRPAGSLGHAGVFAFYPNKQLTTGEGGMVVTDRPEWASVMRSLRNQGREVGDLWLQHTRLGYNYRLDEMSAALGQVQMTRLDELLSTRAQVADRYTGLLADVDGVSPPAIDAATTRMSWFVYVVRLDEGVDRNAVMQALEDEGIPSRPYFSCIHLQPIYRELGYGPGDFPHAEAAGEACVALPFYGRMPADETELVVDALASAVRAQVAAGA